MFFRKTIALVFLSILAVQSNSARAASDYVLEGTVVEADQERVVLRLGEHDVAVPRSTIMEGGAIEKGQNAKAYLNRAQYAMTPFRKLATDETKPIEVRRPKFVGSRAR